MVNELAMSRRRRAVCAFLSVRHEAAWMLARRVRNVQLCPQDGPETVGQDIGLDPVDAKVLAELLVERIDVPVLLLDLIN